MKVKALINCMGIGYDLKKGETAELKEKTAQLLIKFNHAEEVKPPKTNKSKVIK